MTCLVTLKTKIRPKITKVKETIHLIDIDYIIINLFYIKYLLKYKSQKFLLYPKS